MKRTISTLPTLLLIFFVLALAAHGQQPASLANIAPEPRVFKHASITAALRLVSWQDAKQPNW